MPVLRPTGSDFTSFVKAAAQYVPAGAAAKASKSGGVSVAKPGLGAVVRTSQVGALASPTTSAVVINGVTAPASGGGGAAAAAFNPSSITGLALWLDGTDPAGTGIAPANGATVSTWVDKSVNGYNAAAGVAGVYSTAQRTIAFNGTNYYNSPYTAAPTSETLFIVFNLTTNAGPFMISGNGCGGRSAATYTVTRFAGGANCYSWGGVTTDTITTGVNTLGVIVTDGTNNYASLHGALTLAGPGGVTYTSGVTTYIGAHSGPNYLTNGYICEVIAYNSVLSTLNRQKAEGYLAWKWGLQANLPAGHPYKSAAPV